MVAGAAKARAADTEMEVMRAPARVAGTEAEVTRAPGKVADTGAEVKRDPVRAPARTAGTEVQEHRRLLPALSQQARGPSQARQAHRTDKGTRFGTPFSGKRCSSGGSNTSTPVLFPLTIRPVSLAVGPHLLPQLPPPAPGQDRIAGSHGSHPRQHTRLRRLVAKEVHHHGSTGLSRPIRSRHTHTPALQAPCPPTQLAAPRGRYLPIRQALHTIRRPRSTQRAPPLRSRAQQLHSLAQQLRSRAQRPRRPAQQLRSDIH